MLKVELQGVSLSNPSIPTLPAAGFIAGSINTAPRKRDWVSSRGDESSSSDDSEAYNSPPKDDGRGKYRRVQSRKVADAALKKKSNPKLCNSCGCREWSEEGGCCCVCRWYGDRGKKCSCTGCSYADGLADGNKRTKRLKEAMKSVLKEEHDYFRGLSPDEKKDERRNKINVCIRDETRSEYHYKYDLEVGRVGFSYRCCVNGFMGFYDMRESSFDKGTRDKEWKISTCASSFASASTRRPWIL